MRRALLGICALAASGCFASKGDFETLRADVAALSRHQASTDSLQRDELARLALVSRGIRGLSDSLRILNSLLSSSTNATDSAIVGLRQDIAQLQDVTGQSEQRLREIRATLEERAPQTATGPAIDSTAVTAGPGPAQLLRLGRDQMVKRSYDAGRIPLNDLLTRFPESDLAPEALFEIAQSYRAENKLGAADSAYAALATSYPSSPRVPSALYKRALILQGLGRPTEARRLFEDVRRRFPRSPEAALARDRLGAAR